MSKKDEKSGIVKLCGSSGCCPEVDLTNSEEIVLRDDFGGVVRLTKEQWNELLKKFR